jgi:hypothetical protein
MERKDPIAHLGSRVGDSPLVTSASLIERTGLKGLRIKLEGMNPTGTQKDRIAHLEVKEALSRKAPGITTASCGNFGVAVANAAFEMGMVFYNAMLPTLVPNDRSGTTDLVMDGSGVAARRKISRPSAAADGRRNFGRGDVMQHPSIPRRGALPRDRASPRALSPRPTPQT